MLEHKGSCLVRWSLFRWELAVFFFQAEDGIRALVRSRGLGDVYKRQVVHNVELYSGRGGQLVRAAGTGAQILAKEGELVQLRMPSGEVRVVARNCMATIGQVGNVEAANFKLGKAGRKRWLGRRPHTRGSAMTPRDHPHGGGEGKAPIGMPGPKSPWGQPTLGYRTRHNKRTDKDIVRRRAKKR